jgi:hypothetical protein
LAAFEYRRGARIFVFVVSGRLIVIGAVGYLGKVWKGDLDDILDNGRIEGDLRGLGRGRL